MEEGVGPGEAQDLSCLPLSAGDGLEPCPVDLGEVCAVVDYEGHDACGEPVVGKPEKIEGGEVEEDELQDQRGAAHDLYIEISDPPDRSDTGHLPLCHDKAQRQ